MKNMISFFAFLIAFILIPVVCGVAAVSILANAMSFASAWVLILVPILFGLGIGAECALIKLAD